VVNAPYSKEGRESPGGTKCCCAEITSVMPYATYFGGETHGVNGTETSSAKIQDAFSGEGCDCKSERGTCGKRRATSRRNSITQSVGALLERPNRLHPERDKV